MEGACCEELPGKAGMRAYDALEARAGELLGAVNAATAELVVTLAALIELGLGAGYRDAEHYVVLRWGLAPVRARNMVRLAERHTELPDTFARLERGEITEDQAGVLARFATPYRERDVAWAQYATVPQLRTALARLPIDERRAHGLEPAAPEDPATPEDPPAPPDPVRDVAFGYGDDGGWWSRINLPPEEGALFEAALTRARDDLFDHGRGAPTTWADALLHLTGIGLDRLDTATDGRLPSERHQVIIHIDGEDPDGNSRIHLGPMLSTSMRRYLACDCTLTWILERNGQPVAKGRRTRVIDPLLRTLIEDRDQTCVIPGCTQRRWLHCHHLRHWEDGGPTDPDNLIALCPRHHRAHHTGRLQLLGAPGNLRFLHADGKPLEPLRTTAPEVPLPPAPAGPYTGPHAGQRLRIGSPWGWDISPPPPDDVDPPGDAA
jgi:hypothetical protein